MNSENEDITPKNSGNYSLKILWIPMILLLVYGLYKYKVNNPELFPNHTATPIGTVLFDKILVDSLYNKPESHLRQINVKSAKSGIDYLISFSIIPQDNLKIITQASIMINNNSNNNQILMATLYDGYNAYVEIGNLATSKIDTEKVQKRENGLRNEISLMVTSMSHHYFSKPEYYEEQIVVDADGRYKIK